MPVREQDLEDFASGVGPGAYSPQQGSGLPVGAMGGLPLGSASMVPPRTPPPMPPLQAAPAGAPQMPPGTRAPLTLGGQVPDVGQMLAKRLQEISQYDPAKATWEQKGDYYAKLKELEPLSRVANIKSQDQKMQADTMKEIRAQLKEFSALTVEEQNQQRPLMEKLIHAQSRLAGNQFSPEDIAHTLKSSDIAGMYGDVLGPDYDEKERKAIFGQLGTVQPEKRDAILVARRAEKDASFLSLIQTHAPQLIAQMGGSAAKPLEMQAFLNSPEVKQALEQSPGIKRVFNTFVSDPKNSETLAGWGLKPGKIAEQQMAQTAKGPETTAELKDVLLGINGPDGKPLTPATAAALPAGANVTIPNGTVLKLPRGGADVIDLAKQQVFENKIDVSKQQGYNAVKEKARAERDVPLAQMESMKGVHFVNKQTEMPVDRILTAFSHLEKGGGEEKFAVMSIKGYEAFQAAKEADAILGQFLDLSKALTSTPGANFGQAASMWAKTRLGVDNPGVGFEALSGALLRMARAMQGSSQSLSDLDAKSVGGMLPSTRDTSATAIRRLEISAQIVQNMKDVQLGKMQPAKLLDNIAAAKHEIAKMTGVDTYKDSKGQTIAIPKGQSHPGKGWEKQ